MKIKKNKPKNKILIKTMLAKIKKIYKVLLNKLSKNKKRKINNLFIKIILKMITLKINLI